MLTVSQYNSDNSKWENYVRSHEEAHIYHQLKWKKIIESTFGHPSVYLIAQENDIVKGLLPLFLVKSRLFGKVLVSLPFVDRGGLLADDEPTAEALVEKTIAMAQSEQVDFLELRSPKEITHPSLFTSSHKVNFILPCDMAAEVLWKKHLKKNVKNKVRIAKKKQVIVDIGHDQKYIEDFYQVYCSHMRYLGTPVYPKKFFLLLLQEFSENVKIFLAKQGHKIIGGKIILAFKDTLYFFSQYSLREYDEFHPNNILYWAAIEYACNNGYKFCDMGRSNIGSGTSVFKKQWGAEMRPLFWQYYLNKAKRYPLMSPRNPKFSQAVQLWRRLPLQLTKLLGPLIARHIP